jgi:hypothetical protein
MNAPDLVWIVRPGENEELRYSLRSVTRNLPHGKVWIVGDPPAWFVGNVIHPTPAMHAMPRFARVRAMIRLACEDPRIADTFILMCDDQFLREPVDGLAVVHAGPIAEYVNPSRYGDAGRETAALLVEAGYPNPLRYDLHMPITVRKPMLRKALDLADRSGIPDVWLWSIYGNMAGIGGTRGSDPKVYRRSSMPELLERDPATGWLVEKGNRNTGPWLSTTDDSWLLEPGEVIRNAFPEPCRYEDIGRLNVLSITRGSDTAGVGWGLAQAFRDHPIINFRSTAGRPNYINYPQDLPFDQAPSAWANASVVHLHNNLSTYRFMGGDKPFVLHHHGTQYRENADRLNSSIASRGGRAVVSTVDLLQYGPDLTWAPAPYRIDELAAMRRPLPIKGRKLRVGHAPTDRTIKSTDAFLAACARLDVEPVLIEGRTWADCLAAKATVDIFYDQVRLGYGCNAIEAWGMGIPVIAGAPDSTLATMRQVFGTEDLPFYLATEDTIADAIRALMDDDTRDEYTARGLEHVQRFHSGAYTRAVLEPIYQELAAQSAQQPPRLASPALVQQRTVPQGPYDLVIRTTRPCSELRYAVRSLAQNLPHARLWTAGVEIPWLDCPHIDVPLQPGQGRYRHAYAVLRAVLADDRLTSTIILSDDDMFALKPVSEAPSYSRGRLGDVDPGLRRGAYRTTLSLVGPEAPCRDLHVPSLVDRALLAGQLDALDLPADRKTQLWWRTLHGGPEPTFHRDAKIRSKTEPIPPDAEWASTDGEVWRGVAGAALRDLFPVPSRYERG